MNFTVIKNHRRLLIIGLVGFFALLALWLRLLPMFIPGPTDILSRVASDDPQYDLRLVELFLANHFQYAWFDPMSNFPHGTSIYWGPMTIYIAGLACTIAGAITRPAIIGVCLLVTPLFAAATVVLMYFVGKAYGDWKTGLLASGFTAVISGTFFLYSLYGYFNHRDGEVLFSTLFCLVYLYILISETGTTINLADFSTWRKIAILSVLAGIAYLLGLFVMPTMILFAFIVGTFTVVQFLFDFYRGRSSEYLLIANTIVFTIATAGLLVFGFKSPGMDLSTYSIGHVYAYVCLIGATVVLYLLARYLKNRKKYYYPGIIIGSGILFAGILLVAAPQLYTLFINDLYAFFGQQSITQTVMDAMGWTPTEAWQAFNYGFILMAGGILVALYNNLKDERPHEIFALVWALVILFSTWQHVRYEYYLAVVIALLSAVCIHFVFEKGWGDLCTLARSFLPHTASDGADEAEKDQPRRGKGQKFKKSSWNSRKPNYPVLGVVVIVLGLGLLFAYTSVSNNYLIGSSGVNAMNPDWKESLEWLGNNTPDTGVNYFTIYDPKTFQYPSTAYGIMSWWDYGHMITYIAKRIPNANPFQQGVTGDTGAAAYFMTTSENTANAILDADGTRYVITDIEMDTGKFYAMSTWFNASATTGPYQENMFMTGGSSAQNYQVIQLNKQPYYLTMISRLHNFDGSMAQPGSVYYIEYADPAITKEQLPVITNALLLNLSAATLAAEQFNQKAPAGYHAAVLSPSITQPLDTVPALQHYRLVHESPTNAANSDTFDVKYVKIFEYVKGAHIKGTGIIDIPLVTNTGRNFTYRQESVNGEFIVPYSTSDNPYPVKATGPYRIEGTSTTFEVPESVVIQGTTVGPAQISGSLSQENV
ncbi:oligosaccharyl transferase, archaeosortase A system-associated [Methanoregula sp.]|uniref:oligosaccharyl transferase, archaeosortase A system-associated n=1 Tax=Methanoregula sp. TaxID=2052170 RepID=UPI003C1524ED